MTARSPASGFWRRVPRRARRRGGQSEGFGDRVSGQAIGAVRAAHRLAGGEEVRHGRLHVRAGAHAAHVVVRDGRDLDGLARQVDAVGGEAVDHRAERLAQHASLQC